MKPPVGTRPHAALARERRLDLRKPEVLSAWQAALAQLEARGQPDGMAALLLRDPGPAPKSAETIPLLTQARRHLPMLVSSTRQVDISGALAAALPLMGAGPGLTPSWDDFLMGYLCGLRTSPLLDAQCLWFLREFGDAMVTASVCSTSVSQAWIERTVRGDGPPWIRLVLEAIGCGSVTVSALLVERASDVGHTSGTDSVFGALLGSALWKACPNETELVGRLRGTACLSSSDGVMP